MICKVESVDACKNIWEGDVMFVDENFRKLEKRFAKPAVDLLVSNTS
jgi:hypothetical protein